MKIPPKGSLVTFKDAGNRIFRSQGYTFMSKCDPDCTNEHGCEEEYLAVEVIEGTAFPLSNLCWVEQQKG